APGRSHPCSPDNTPANKHRRGPAKLPRRPPACPFTGLPNTYDWPAWLSAALMDAEQRKASDHMRQEPNDAHSDLATIPTPLLASRLNGVLDWLASSEPRTGRNNKLHWASKRFGEAVAAGRIEYAEAEAELYGAAVACGYVAKDGEPATRKTIRSGLRGTDGN
ncbi:MAG: hypothetical protein ACRETA_14375, partial [Gammaproteobacteria bacterium]